MPCTINFLISRSSHELVETLTDPWYNGWQDAFLHECAGEWAASNVP